MYMRELSRRYSSRKSILHLKPLTNRYSSDCMMASEASADLPSEVGTSSVVHPLVIPVTRQHCKSEDWQRKNQRINESIDAVYRSVLKTSACVKRQEDENLDEKDKSKKNSDGQASNLQVASSTATPNEVLEIERFFQQWFSESESNDNDVHTASTHSNECKDINVSSRKRSRMVRCGRCTSCMLPDCGICSYCLDKPKFGGPSKKKKPCVTRKCQNMRKSGAALTAATTLCSSEETEDS